MKTLKLIVFAMMLGLTHVCMAQDGDDENVTLPTREIDGKTFYEIGSADDMAAFSLIVRREKEANGILTADIDMSQATKQLRIINEYNGTFDGDFHTISNLHIENINTIGLFYNIKSDAHLTRITIKDAVVTGTQYVAALCGMNEGGRISQCSVSGGTLTATESFCAPICATMTKDSKTDKNAVIENCFTDNVTITTPAYGSGIVADAGAGTTIACCFSYKNTYSGTHGGICANLTATVENCYIDVSEFYVSKQFEGKIVDSESSVNAAKFNNGYVALHLNNGKFLGSVLWRQDLSKDNSLPMYIGTDDMKVIPHSCYGDKEYVNLIYFNADGYCRLCDKAMVVHENDGWYEISNPGQLYSFNEMERVSGLKVRLLNDIIINKNMLNSDGELQLDESSLREWNTELVLYNTVFDGQNHCISGLYCSKEDLRGLFRRLDRKCLIRNLCIRDSYFQGTRVGAIASNIDCPEDIVIENCIISAKFKGEEIGGIAGTSNNSNNSLKIESCTVSGFIENGCKNVGAILGTYDDVEGTKIVISNCNVSESFNGKIISNYEISLEDTHTKIFTTENAKSGEMTYLLNNKTTSPYRQHLGYDFGPVFSDNDEYNVYPESCDPSTKVFSNVNQTIHNKHDYTASTLYPGAQESACYCREKMDLKYKTTEDPDNKGTYYSTFYDSKNAFSVSDGMVPYTGTVEELADSRVLRMAAIEDNVIPAGEAVVIKGTTPEMILTKKATDAKASETNALTGCDVATAAPDNSYIFSYGQYKLGFYRYAAGKSLGAHKAYITLANSLNSKPFVMSFDDVDLPTSISSLLGEDREDSQHSATSIYNIGGMRMPALQRGINIVNGKKILNY